MSTETLEGRQKTFAEKVAEGHTATEAYLLAGYRPVKRETAHRAASRLYANPGVRAYIRELRRTGDELAREETTLTIAKKLAFLARLVLTSSASLREDDPLIQSHRILKDGSTSIRIPCKLKALKMHSELAGHFLPKPTEPPPPVDTLQLFFDQIRSGTALDDQETDTGLDATLLEDQKSETRIPASVDEQERTVFPQENTGLCATVLEPQRGETRTQASTRAVAPQCGPTVIPTETLPRRIASPPGCDGIASQPHLPLAQTEGISSTNPMQLPSSSDSTSITHPTEQVPQPQQTSTYHVAVPPPRDETWTPASAAEPHAHSFSARKTLAFGPSNPPSPPERPSASQTPLPVCKLKTEPLKTPPPLSPLTQARKAAIAYLQQTSPIRHLYK